MTNRWLIRSRRWLVYVAALPLLQFSQCRTTVGQTVLGVQSDLPSILVTSLSDAFLQTLFDLLGLGSQALFGATGSLGLGGS